ncbi:tetratricopeptide repeat protein [uncultured Desulfobacter sp.]|uniref:tetratricopeptide repeat protein n=1 Tax=uncultured Desulfobacter sp. TaxID=240139 RepID=UPI002AA865D1|nr:tetratricopeptide repeat protein [uncultured Desulfobacter sp.]
MDRVLWLWVCLVFVFIILSPCALLAAGRESDPLPFAAGACANKVAGLMEKKSFAKAVQEIESFQAKAKTVDSDTAHKKGYTHYYLDFLLGNCCMMMEKQGTGYVKKAASSYERAVKKYDGFYQAWLNLGRCRYTLKQMGKAAQSFVRGYDTSPEKKGAYLYQAAACYYFNADYQKALNAFNRLMKNHPAEVTLDQKEVLVNILFSLKKNRQALPYLKELAAKSKGDKKRTWQEVLLYQYMELGMDKQAVALASTLTRQEPEEPKWWRALAHLHFDKNRLEKGLEAFMIYSFTTPLTASETKLLADLYAGCNIPLEAARVYEDWLEKIQKSPDGFSGMGRKKMTDRILAIARAYQQGRDYQAAIKWADRGLARGCDARLLAFKADLLFREKNYKAAYAAYKNLAGRQHSPGRSWLMAGYAALSCDNPQQAKQAFCLACKCPKVKSAALAALEQIRAMRAAEEI